MNGRTRRILEALHFSSAAGAGRISAAATAYKTQTVGSLVSGLAALAAIVAMSAWLG